VYFGAAGATRAPALAASVVMPHNEGFPSAGSIAFLNSFAIIGELAVSGACVFRRVLAIDGTVVAGLVE
jgi:hypothetical protein